MGRWKVKFKKELLNEDLNSSNKSNISGGRMAKGTDWEEALIYLLIAALVVYAVLKIAGVIHSPAINGI